MLSPPKTESREHISIFVIVIVHQGLNLTKSREHIPPDEEFPNTPVSNGRTPAGELMTICQDEKYKDKERKTKIQMHNNLSARTYFRVYHQVHVNTIHKFVND